MVKGETVELLVNYGKGYEGTRERKGYGLRNIEDNLQSDEAYSAKLRRDHADRTSMQEMILSMTFMEVKNSIEFLEDRIIEPLVQYTDVYFSNVIAQSTGSYEQNMITQRKVTNRQLVARFRLNWIGELFRRRLDTFLADKNLNLDRNITRNLYKILDPKRLDSSSFFKRNSTDPEVVKLFEMHLAERFEDTLLRISCEYGLFHSYEPSLWCELSRNLCRDLLRNCINLQQRSQQNLAEAIYNIATTAVTTLKNCCKTLSSYSTPQQIAKAHRLLGFVRTDNKVINSHLRSKLLHDSKDDNVHLLETGSNASTSSHPMALANSLQVMCISMAPDTHDQDKQSMLPLVLRCTSNTSKSFTGEDSNEVLKSGRAKVDEEWYLLWQIIRVVHTISLHCIQWNSHSYYSIEKLCDKVGVKANHAQLMLAMKMAQPFESSYSHNDETLVENKKNVAPTTVKKKDSSIAQKAVYKQKNMAQYEARRKELRLKTAQTLADKKSKGVGAGPLYEEKDGTIPPGWRVDYVKRHSSNHVDRYWYSVTDKKLRSRVEVRLFLDLIKKSDGDEEAAWKKFPGNRKKKW